jgi:hypothetical protein
MDSLNRCSKPDDKTTCFPVPEPHDYVVPFFALNHRMQMRNKTWNNGDDKVNKRKILFVIITGIFLLAGSFMGVLGMLGFLPWQSGDLYADPQGRFTLEVGPGWEQVQTDQPYTQFHVADPPVTMYVLAIPAGTVDEAFVQAAGIAGMDPALLKGGAIAQIEDWQAYSTQDASGPAIGSARLVVEGNAYVLVVRADEPGVGIENNE